MKKRGFLVVALVVLLALTTLIACSATPSTTAAPKSTAPGTTTSAAPATSTKAPTTSAPTTTAAPSTTAQPSTTAKPSTTAPATTTTTAAAAIKWRAWSYESVGEPGYTYVAKIAEAVTKASGGRLTITPYAGETLGYTQDDIFKVMRQDGIELGQMTASHAAGDAPLTSVTTLPFLCPDPARVEKIVDALQPMYDQITPPFHAKRISVWSATPAVLSAKRSVDTVEGWKGLKVRSYSDALTQMIKLLGGTPVSLPYSEVYSATSTGIVEGHLWSPRGTYDGKLYEILKYASLWYPSFADDMLIMNTTAFNKLPKDLQDLLMKTVTDLRPSVWADAYGNVDKDLQMLKDKGMNLVPVSNAEKSKAAQLTKPVYDDFLKQGGPEALKWLNVALAAAGQPAYK